MGHRRRERPRNDKLEAARERLLSPTGSGRPMSRRELAEAVNAYLWDTYREKDNLAENDIGKLERGVIRWPRERRREAFRAVLNAKTDAELGFYINRVTRSRASTRASPSREAIPNARATVVGPVRHSEPVDPPRGGPAAQIEDLPGRTKPGPVALTDWRMTRRDVFRCVCGGMAAAALLRDCYRCEQSQRVIHALDALISSSDDKVSVAVDSLGELASRYSTIICATPPTSVYEELLNVRFFAGSLLDHVARTERRRLDLILMTGWLSCLLGIVTCDMGDHAAALLWCSDAERRSREAGHPEIASWATLTRSTIAFYQGQAGHAVALAEQGQQIAPVGSVAYAKLAAQEMRAWAMLRRPDEMKRARGRAGRAIARLPSDVATTGAFSIPLAEDPPYTATSLLLVDQYREAVSATDRMLKIVYSPEAWGRDEMPSSYARSLLILALGHAGLGQVDSAVASGCTALDSAPSVWPTMVLAGKLDRTLTRRFGDVAEVADYHARYVDAASRTTTGQRRPSTQLKDQS